METWEELNKSWNRLVADRTMEDYETQLGLMHATFPAASMRYVETTWLTFKEKLFAAFLRNKRHYGHVTTSRVESAHAALKKWIDVSTGKFLIHRSFSLVSV